MIAFELEPLPIPLVDEHAPAECPYCGEAYELDLFEFYPECRSFTIYACCEEVQNRALLEVEETDSPSWRALFAAYSGEPVRRTFTDCGHIELDCGLVLEEIERTDAAAFIAKHHRHHKAPPGWRFGIAVRNGEDLVGVAWCGRPVARMIDASTTLEVNRLCIDPTLAPELVEHACSKLYGAAAREAKRRGFEKVITYTLAESESGASVAAAGWIPEHKTRGGSWNRPSRARADSAPVERKIRWARYLTRK